MRVIIIFYDNEADELLRFDLDAFGLGVSPVPRAGEDVTITVEGDITDAVCKQVHWEYNFDDRNVFVHVVLTDLVTR